jgi:hypothetical protein
LQFAADGVEVARQHRQGGLAGAAVAAVLLHAADDALRRGRRREFCFEGWRVKIRGWGGVDFLAGNAAKTSAATATLSLSLSSP